MTNEISLSMLKQMYAEIQKAVLFVRKDGKIINGNAAALSLFNVNQIASHFVTDYLSFDCAQMHTKEVAHVLDKKLQGPLYEVKSIPVSEEIYCLMIEDLSLRKNTTLNNCVQNLLERSSEGIVIYMDDQIIDCDVPFAKIFGYSQLEMVELSMEDLLTEDSATMLSVQMKYSEEATLKLVGRHKNNKLFHMQFTQNTYRYDGYQITIAIVQDISELIAHEEKLAYMAYYDELTNLPNRQYFNKEINQAIKEAEQTAEQFAVYYIDLDGFKQINDTLGQDFGDQLLKASGKRLEKSLQENTFLARIEGDQFLILYRHIQDKDEAVHFIEKLISAYHKPFEIEGYEMNMTISIGISIYPNSAQTATNLIRYANSAMYVIKGDERNYYHLFEKSVSSRFKMMLTMENDLRKAVERDQLELYYQPQKSLTTNEVVGVEALLRWNHPTKGMISPRDFIPLAERTGIIIDIGDWVLVEACKQNKQWQKQGYDPIVMSVNLSAKQFHQRILVEKITKVLNETGLEPAYLELELTESMAMTNEDFILKTMDNLQKLGVIVSIDDFGTGYSSLKYLSLFPVNKLKIDRMFMNTHLKQNQAIVKSIIHMSHSLDIEVIAEGVETFEQFLFLQEEQCDQVQGFYFSKPVPAYYFTRFLQQSS